MDYWKECILGALNDSGLQDTDDQIENIVGWVEGAYENYGMATGADCIQNPMLSEVEALKNEIKQLKSQHQRQIDGVAKGVAYRRNVDVRDVSIDENGHVTYG